MTEELPQRHGWQFQAPGAQTPPCDWAEQGYRFEADAFLGHVCLGTHAGRPFYVLTRMPGEYADGFGPRAGMILRHLRWRDTGEGL